MEGQPWILALCSVILIANQVVNYVMLFELFCRGDQVKRRYLKMMTSSPANYIFLGTYSASLGVMLGFICSFYTAESVAYVLCLAATIITVLTIYAVVTKSDFTDRTPYLLVSLC